MKELLHGDCRDILPKLDMSKAVIVTDPPFNIGYHYGEYKDRMENNKYLEMLAGIMKTAPTVLIHYPETLYQIAVWGGYVPERVVSWVYNSNTAKQHRDIAFFGIKPDFNKVRQPYKNLADKRIQKRIAEGKTGAKLYDWWNINQVKNVSKDKTGHPCQMPLEVMKNIVGILPPDKVIVDPFMGSGTTGLACMEMGRDFIGIEIDTDYYKIAADRLTGLF